MQTWQSTGSMLKIFYGDVLGMDIAMDLGWIMTFAADGSMTPQIGVMTVGGSGTTSRTAFRRMDRSARFPTRLPGSRPPEPRPTHSEFQRS